LKSLIEKLRNGRDLNGADVDTAVAILLSPDVGDEVKADFLTALHRKGETTEEIAAFVQSLMKRAVDPMIDRAEMPGPMVDVCGTGGDGVDSFNISTTVAFVVAAGGAVVVKHGNRRVTSSCGSADVLEQLGVPIDLPPEQLRESLKRHSVGFLFARQYHPAFRALAETRERLARQNARTIFNALGPLLNPARPSRQLIGVYSPHLTGIFAQVLRELRHEHAWIVHGLADNSAGMDDISVSGATTVAELIDDKVTSAILDVSWLGIPRAPVGELRGGDARENAATIDGILSGKVAGAKRDMTIVNAAGNLSRKNSINRQRRRRIRRGRSGARSERRHRIGAGRNRQRPRVGEIARAAKLSREVGWIDRSAGDVNLAPKPHYSWHRARDCSIHDKRFSGNLRPNFAGARLRAVGGLLADVGPLLKKSRAGEAHSKNLRRAGSH
jgi:anthranilate phosphoribosyltransferase